MKRQSDEIFDELLVLRCQSGDGKALAILVKRWHKKLLRHANRHLQDSEASKDVVQECWQVVIKGISKLKDPSRFGVWVLSITRKKAIDSIRKRQVVRRTELNTELTEAMHESHDHIEMMMNKMKRALAELPDNQRLVLSMFYSDGHPIAEIAIILGIPIGTVKSRLYHGREHLKTLMK